MTFSQFDNKVKEVAKRLRIPLELIKRWKYSDFLKAASLLE